VVHLSLRYCGITSLGARYLGEALGCAAVQNGRLLSLDLAGNHVGDAGVSHLARGLRLNRTLLVLNLAGNDIGDPGACQLAEVTSRQLPSIEDGGPTDRVLNWGSYALTLTLTSELDLQSHQRYVHDPYTCKRSRYIRGHSV